MKAVTYLDDVINETLRVRPALVSGGYRVTPAEGLQVDEQFIPSDVNVFVPTPTIHRDPRYWQKPDEFLPERFGERREEMGTDGAPYIPFNLGDFSHLPPSSPPAPFFLPVLAIFLDPRFLGAYQCPGKNLALESLRISVSRICQEFNLSVAPGEMGDTFEAEVVDTFTTRLPPLKICLAARS